jgi:hypothetical protein
MESVKHTEQRDSWRDPRAVNVAVAYSPAGAWVRREPDPSPKRWMNPVHRETQYRSAGSGYILSREQMARQRIVQLRFSLLPRQSYVVCPALFWCLEADGDPGLFANGFAVQQVRGVPPLSHYIHRGPS